LRRFCTSPITTSPTAVYPVRTFPRVVSSLEDPGGPPDSPSNPPANPGGTAFNPESQQAGPGLAPAGRNLELTGASLLKIEPGLRTITAGRLTFKPGRLIFRAGRLSFGPGDAPAGLKSEPAGRSASSEAVRGEPRILSGFRRREKSPQAGFRETSQEDGGRREEGIRIPRWRKLPPASKRRPPATAGRRPSLGAGGVQSANVKRSPGSSPRACALR